MSSPEIKLYFSKKDTGITWCKPGAEVFKDFEPKMKSKLLPLISLDISLLSNKYTGEVHFIHQNIYMDWLKFRWEDSKYTLLETSDKLDKIEDLSEMDRKKKFLKTYREESSKLERIYWYDEKGLLIRTEPVRAMDFYNSYERFTWQDTAAGPRMKTAEVASRHLMS